MPRTFLRDDEEQVLGVIHFDPRCPVKTLSKRIGLPEYTIRRVIRRLKNKGIIKFRPMINVYMLGLTQYAVFFSLASAGQKVHIHFRDKLVRSDEVSFVCELGGEHQYGITICARSAVEVLAFLGKLSKEFGAALNEHILSIQTRLYDFPCKFFLSKVSRNSSCSWGLSNTVIKIDKTDHLILSALRQLSDYSLTELAHRSDLPISTVDYRLHKLEEQKVISGYFYQINTEKFGFYPYLLTVYTRGVAPPLTKRMVEFARNEDAARIVVETMGAWDYEIGIEVKTPKDASLVAQRLHEEFRDDIRSIRILPVLSYSKVENYPFRTFRI